jgi:hypothetical protein
MQRKIYLFISVLAFILLLVYSNDLIILLTGSQFDRVVEVSHISIHETEGELLYNVENAIANQDIFHSVEIQGWAFTPNQSYKADTEFNLLLISNDRTYKIDAVVVERIDLKSLFKENNAIGIQHGFISTFTPLKIHDGYYQLWLHFRQCENDYFVDTKLRMEKTLKNLEPITQTLYKNYGMI